MIQQKMDRSTFPTRIAGFLFLFGGIKFFKHDSGLVAYTLNSKSTNKPVDLEYYSPDSVIIKGEELRRLNLSNQIQIIPEYFIDKYCVAVRLYPGWLHWYHNDYGNWIFRNSIMKCRNNLCHRILYWFWYFCICCFKGLLVALQDYWNKSKQRLEQIEMQQFSLLSKHAL